MAEGSILDAIKAKAPKRSVLDEIRARAQAPTAGERLLGGTLSAARGVAEPVLSTFADFPTQVAQTLVPGRQPHESILGGRAARIRSGLSTAVPQSVQNEEPGIGRFLTTTFPEGLGSTLGFGLAGGGLGMAGAAIVGALTGGSAAYHEAKAAGVSEGTAWTAWALNAGLGTSEALPLGRILERYTGGQAGGAIKAALLSATEEGAQEAFQQVGSNLVASETYDEDRKALEGLGESAAAGGLTGFILSAIGSAVGARTRNAGTAQEGLRNEVPSQGIPSAEPVDESAAAPVPSAPLEPENAGQPLPQAQEAASTTTAPIAPPPAPPSEPAVQMTLKIGARSMPVGSAQEASEVYQRLRDASGVGASELPSATLEPGGLRISYNGRVWGPNRELIYDPDDASPREVEAEVVQPTPEPTLLEAVKQKAAEPDPLTDPKVRAELEGLAAEAGWAEAGGRLMRDDQGEVVGRTKWAPKAEWWSERPAGMTERSAKRLVAKVLENPQAKLGEKQAQHLEWLIGQARDRAATPVGGADWNTRRDEAVRQYLERSNSPVGRFLAANQTEGEVVEPSTPEEIYAAEFLKQRGAKLTLVKAAEPLKLPGMYKKGEVLLDARRQGALKALAFHEVTHRLAEELPGSYQALFQELAAADREGLASLGEEYQRRFAQTGRKLSPTELAEEATAFYAESIPTYLEQAFEKPERLAALAQSNPGLLRRIADAIVQALQKIRADFGLKTSQQKALLALRRELARTPFEQGLAPDVAARVAQRIASAVNELRGPQEATEQVEGREAAAVSDEAPFAADDLPQMPKGRVIGKTITGEPIYEKEERGALKRPGEGLKKPKATQLGAFDEQGGLFEKQAEERDRGSMFAVGSMKQGPSIADLKQRIDDREARIRAAMKGDTVLLHGKGEHRYFISKDASKPGRYRTSHFMPAGQVPHERARGKKGMFPVAHSEHATLDEAIREAAKDGLEPVSADEPRFAVAFHGSPYDFDRFDSSKIGSGEGAQSFGHGLYFTDKREIAEHYRNKLAGDAPTFVHLTDEENDRLPSWLAKSVSRGVVGLEERLADFRQRLAEHEQDLEPEREAKGGQPWVVEDRIRGAKEIIEILEKLQRLGTESRPAGKLYTVELAPQEDEYLLWDRPLSEQSEKVQKALRGSDIWESLHPRVTKQPDWMPSAFGKTLYEDLTSTLRDTRGLRSGDEASRGASDYLRSIGIRGIKYLTGDSRNKPLKDIRREVFEALPDDAEFSDVEEVLESGKVKPEIVDFLRELKANDWFGFDYPAQAISAALGKDVSNFEPTPELLKTIAKLQEGASYNYVLFDDKDVTIREKFAVEADQDGQEGFDLPAEGRLRRIYTALVDDLERIKQAERVAPQKLEGESVSQTLQLHPGRKFGGIEKLGERFVEPIKKALKTWKISPDDAAEFLYALHAPTRNAIIAERSPEKFGTESNPGSGMTNSEAKAIVEKAMASEAAPGYRRLRRLNRQLNKLRLDTLEQGGLLSSEARAEWEKFGSDYVPLRTKGEPGKQVFGTRSFNVSGKESKRAEGRKSRADSPLIFGLATAEQAIERAERNKVGQKLAELVEANPEGPWRIESDANAIDQDAGEIGLRFKQDGEQKFIVVKDKALADAFKRIVDPEPGALKALDPINKWLRSVIISYNPVFPLTNVPRDIGTAAIKSAITGDWQATLGALKGALPAAHGAWRAIRNPKSKGYWQDVYRKARDAGALIGWSQPQDFEQRAQEFQKVVDGAGSLKEKGAAFLKFWKDANSATELGTRLAVFDALVKAGQSEQEAAVKARRVTADFARRGRWAPVYSRLWLFSGANVQGTAEMAEAIAKNPRRASLILGGLVGLGFGMAMLSFVYGDDDELAKLSEEEKARFFGVQIGKTRYGVAAPYGFNVFPYLGWKMAEAVAQDEPVEDVLGNVARATLDSMSPLPRGANLMQQATPTALRPFAEIAQNRNFADVPIAPEVDPFDPSPPPNVDRAFKGVSPVSKGIAEGLYEGTGELVDVSPEWIDHLAKAATGGAGTFAGRFSENVRKTVMGELEPERVEDIPIVGTFARSFAQQPSRGADARLYYELRTEIDEANDRSKKGRTLSDRQKRLLAIRPRLLAVERELKRQREARKALEGKAAQAIDAAILEAQKRFLEAAKAATKKP